MLGGHIHTESILHLTMTRKNGAIILCEWHLCSVDIMTISILHFLYWTIDLGYSQGIGQDCPSSELRSWRLSTQTEKGPSRWSRTEPCGEWESSEPTHTNKKKHTQPRNQTTTSNTQTTTLFRPQYKCPHRWVEYIYCHRIRTNVNTNIHDQAFWTNGTGEAGMKSSGCWK